MAKRNDTLVRFISTMGIVCFLIGSKAFAQYTPFYSGNYEPSVSTGPYAGQYNVTADPTTASLESRIAALEGQVVKKQDKPVPTGKFVNKLGGRVFLDGYSFADQDTAGGYYANQGNIVSLRELRLTLSGEGYNILDYKAEFGVGAPAKSDNTTEDSINIQDIYLGVKNIPFLDYVKIGHYKPETSLAFLQGTNYLTGMEIVNSATLMSYGRRLGISSSQYFADDRVRWFNGFFGDEAGQFSSNKYYNNDRQGYMFNSRLTALPFYSSDGRKYLHLGVSYAYLDLVNDNYGFNVKPAGIANADRFFGYTIPTDHVSTTGFEFAWNLDRLGTQFELFHQDANQGYAMGGYVEVRYMLSNAYRSYDKRSATIGVIEMSPEKNFNIVNCNGLCCPQSLGAWEVFGQFSHVDYSHYVAGCRENDFVLGMNWFWNPQTRMVFEYIYSEPTDQHVKGSTDTIAMSMRFFF